MLPRPDSNEETELFNEGKEELALVELAREEGLAPDVVRSEVNFLVLPFFALWDKDVKKKTETECRLIIKSLCFPRIGKQTEGQ